MPIPSGDAEDSDLLDSTRVSGSIRESVLRKPLHVVLLHRVVHLRQPLHRSSVRCATTARTSSASIPSTSSTPCGRSRVRGASTTKSSCAMPNGSTTCACGLSYGAQGNIDRINVALHSRYVEQHLGSAEASSKTRIDVTSPPNQNLRWETTYSWNTALDFAAFEHRIGFTFELYGRRQQGPDHHAHDPFGDGIHLDIEQLRRNLKQGYRVHAQHGERPHARLPLGDLDQHRPQHRQGRKGAYRRQQLEPLRCKAIRRAPCSPYKTAGLDAIRHSDVLARRTERSRFGSSSVSGVEASDPWVLGIPESFLNTVRR